MSTIQINDCSLSTIKLGTRLWQKRLSRPCHVAVKAGADAATSVHVALADFNTIFALRRSDTTRAPCFLDSRVLLVTSILNLQNPELVCWPVARAGLQIWQQQAVSQLLTPVKRSSSGPTGFASLCMRASPGVLALLGTLHPAGN